MFRTPRPKLGQRGVWRGEPPLDRRIPLDGDVVLALAELQPLADPRQEVVKLRLRRFGGDRPKTAGGLRGHDLHWFPPDIAGHPIRFLLMLSVFGLLTLF